MLGPPRPFSIPIRRPHPQPRSSSILISLILRHGRQQEPQHAQTDGVVAVVCHETRYGGASRRHDLVGQKRPNLPASLTARKLQGHQALQLFIESDAAVYKEAL